MSSLWRVSERPTCTGSHFKCLPTLRLIRPRRESSYSRQLSHIGIRYPDGHADAQLTHVVTLGRRATVSNVAARKISGRRAPGGLAAGPRGLTAPIAPGHRRHSWARLETPPLPAHCERPPPCR